jgi:hypothetical protein
MPSCNQYLKVPRDNMNRLLDPSYSSPSLDNAFPHVYVDQYGVHDADYNDFPTINHAQKQPKKSLENRFAWELEAAALDDLDDEDLPAPRRPSLSSGDYPYSSGSTPSSPAFPSTPSLVDDLESEDHHQQGDLTLSKTVSHPEHHVDLRKEWLAVRLRVRTKVFRAKKKLTNSRSF